MSRFQRPLHRVVLNLLSKLDASFLEAARCYFGGGTRIVLELGEYRQSLDIDFMCADQAGYRAIREAVTEHSLGPIAAKPVVLVREIRADQYGIRTRLESGRHTVKFEIVREARIALAGSRVPGIPVACLGRAACVAEKFLANADRGLDRSTLSRDIVDLAFMAESWGMATAGQGCRSAMEAYGKEVLAKLDQTLELMKDRTHRARCIEALQIEDSKTLVRGLAAMTRLDVGAPAAPPAPRSTRTRRQL